MRKQISKRVAAIMLASSIAATQSNVPANLFHFDFGPLVANAAEETVTPDFSVNLSMTNVISNLNYEVPFFFKVTDTMKQEVSIVNLENESYGKVGSCSLTIPETITYNGTTYTITGIYSNSLDGLSVLEEVTIPPTVRTIGQNAFGSDITLNKVTFAVSDNYPVSNLTTIGESAFTNCRKLKEIVLPANLAEVGSKAFSDCAELETVTFEGTTVPLQIGDSAFADLGMLSSVLLPDSTASIGKEAFKGCTILKAINIPSALTAIEASTFEDCKQLTTTDVTNYRKSLEPNSTATYSTNILFPEGIETIGDAAFKNCTKLQQIDLSQTKITTLNKEVFSGCKSIQGDPGLTDDVSVIDDYAFYDCANLFAGTATKDGKVVEVVYPFTAPKSLMTIGAFAFAGCQDLGSVDWNNCSVNTIKEGAFKDCTDMDILTIPPTITEVSDELCSGCTKLGRLNLPTGVTKIGESAFAGTNMAQIHFYDNDANDITNNAAPEKYIYSKLETLGKNAFNSASLSKFFCPPKLLVIEQGTFKDCALSELKFNDVITTIGISAFEGCKLETITVPATVTSLQSSAFKNCQSLTTAKVLNNTITKLSGSMFEGCTKLASVTLPESVVELDSSAFSGCSSLTSFTMPGFSKIASIGDSCFKDCAKLPGINDTTGILKFASTFKSLGSQAFMNCTKITNVDLSESTINTVNSEAFSGTNLNTIAFPATLTNIGANAFKGCSLNNLRFLPLEASKLTVAVSAFRDNSKDDGDRYITSNPKITVPASRIQDYIEFFNEKLGFDFTTAQINADTIIDATSITLSQTEVKTYIGGSTQLAVQLSDNATETITYTTSDPTIATVDGAGKITGVNLGTATITATTSKTGLSATCTVTVSASSSSKPYVKDPIITIKTDATQIGSTSDSSNRFYVGDSVTVLTQTGTETGSSDATAVSDYLTWNLTALDDTHPVTTTKEGDYTIVENGYVRIKYNQKQAIITAIAYTSQTIRATVSSLCGTNATVNISISTLVDSITANKPSETKAFSTSTLNAKGYFTCSPAKHAEQITYTSSNASVATVDQNGIITPVGVGSTTITATSAKSGKSASFELTYTNAISKVATSDNVSSYNVIAGQSFNITAFATYQNPTMASNDTLTVESTSPEIATATATISGSTLNIAVNTLKSGSANINVLNSEKQAVATFRVNAGDIKLKSTALNLYTKGAYKTGTIELDSTTPVEGVTYSMADSKSSKIASVSNTGVVTGKKAGEAKVNVTAYGSTVTCTVKVTASDLGFNLPGSTYNKKKKTYTISKKSKSVTVGITPNYIKTDAQKVTYKSSKKKVATISKKGILKIKKKGTTTLTITCNKVKYKFKVKVTK